MSKEGFEKKLTAEGIDNPKYVDLLDEDRPISGQTLCMSYHFYRQIKVLKTEKLLLIRTIPKIF